jgi:hypothetical protein
MWEIRRNELKIFNQKTTLETTQMMMKILKKGLLQMWDNQVRSGDAWDASCRSKLQP